MQGLVAALDVRVVVARPPGPSKTQRATWGVFVRGQRVAGEVREWTGPHLRLDAPVTQRGPDLAAARALVPCLHGHPA